MGRVLGRLGGRFRDLAGANFMGVGVRNRLQNICSREQCFFSTALCEMECLTCERCPGTQPQADAADCSASSPS